MFNKLFILVLLSTACNELDPLDLRVNPVGRINSVVQAEAASTRTELDEIKDLYQSLKDALEKETADRKAADLDLQTQINTINRRLGEIDISIAGMSAQVAEREPLFLDLNNEFINLKNAFNDHLKDLENRQKANQDKLDGLNRKIADLNKVLASEKELSAEALEKLKADISLKQAEYDAAIKGLALTQTEAAGKAQEAIEKVSAGLVRDALEAEHRFALEIKKLAEDNRDLIIAMDYKFSGQFDSVVQTIGVLQRSMDSRFDAVGEMMNGLSAAISVVDQSLADAEARINVKLKESNDRSDAYGRRIQALETFENVSKFCAAASAGLQNSQRQVLDLQNSNRKNFGPTNLAPYGYGNMFAKYNRFKNAEQLFDRYSYNEFYLRSVSNQILTLQKACSTMVAFPRRPSDGGQVTMGITESELAGVKSIEWPVDSKNEILRIFRIVPKGLQDKSDQKIITLLNKIMSSYYSEMPPHGSLIGELQWDLVFMSLVQLVTNGLDFVGTSLAFAQREMIADSVLQGILGTAGAPATLCRFGQGNGASDGSDLDYLRYDGLESVGSADSDNYVNWHLPQQYYYYEEGNSVFIAESNYAMSMGPSANQVDQSYKSTGFQNASNAAELLQTASSLNDFGSYPTTLERNVYPVLSNKWRDTDKICSIYTFDNRRSGLRNMSLPRRAQIPTRTINGCQAELIYDSGSVCQSVVFRPEGNQSSPNWIDRKVVPVALSHFPAGKSGPIMMTSFTKTAFPDAIMKEDATYTFVLDLRLESERNDVDPRKICLDAARYPFESLSGRVSNWGSLTEDFTLNKIALKRRMAPAASPRFLVQSCQLASTTPYNQPLIIDGQPSSKFRLTFSPDFLLPVPGVEYLSRPAVTASRCADACIAIDRNGDRKPDNGKGRLISFGTEESKFQEVPMRDVPMSSSSFFRFDMQKMIDRDVCECEF